MLSLSLCSKVITLSRFYCTCLFYTVIKMLSSYFLLELCQIVQSGVWLNGVAHPSSFWISNAPSGNQLRSQDWLTIHTLISWSHSGLIQAKFKLPFISCQVLFILFCIKYILTWLNKKLETIDWVCSQSLSTVLTPISWSRSGYTWAKFKLTFMR